MRFFLDVNIPHSLLELFEELGLEVQHAKDVGLSKAEDIEIMKIVESLKEFLSSIDIKDLERALTIVELGRYRTRKFL